MGERFALTHPGSEPKSEQPKAKRRAAPKPKAVDGAAHQKVVAHYVEAFEAKRGQKPIFGGAEGTAVKRLLEKLKGDADEANRRITIAFASFRAATVTIRDLAANPDAFATAEKPRGANRVVGAGAQGTSKADVDELLNRPQYQGIIQ